MRIIKYILTLCLLVLFICALDSGGFAQRRRNNMTNAPTAGDSAARASTASGDEAEKAELKAILDLPPATRIEKLKAFIEAHPNSDLKTRAAELIVSAHAALGDEKLKAGDAAGGIEQFRMAITESPRAISDKLYTEVVSTLPLNLFLRGERAAAIETARLIEERVKDDPKRLLAIAAFYLNIEDVNEATRLSELAVKLAPEMAAAHQALGAAHHIALRLDDAAKEYTRALELDPKLSSARLSLADLRRAGGHAEEALALYQTQLKDNPADKNARSGLILSLLDLGKKEEATRELETALKDEPNNLALLVGAAYWYAAHNESERALELAQKAVEVEPRYTWAQIALGRALVGQKRPLDAERVLRFARQYGRFPTLDYELASALAAAGFYEEAALELERSFTLRDGQIETQLAGRTPARAASFIELLAPERRASIFQPVAADDEASARLLKNLLAFHLVINPATGREAMKEADVAALAQEFAAGEDPMRAYRQLYAASRLLQNKIAFQTVLDLAAAATTGVDAALDVPGATVAVLADNLREIRARAIASNSTPAVPDVPRNVLSNILRGRIEDLTGTILLNQDKTAEAVEHLRRAVSVLPESTIWWRTAWWHLGVALDTGGNSQEALVAYLTSYKGGAADAARRAVIEALYRKVHGSLNGLEEELGSSSSASSSNVNAGANPQPQTENATAAVDTSAAPQAKGSEVKSSEVAAAAAAPSPAEATSTPSQPSTTPEQTVTPTPAPTPEATSQTQPTETTTPTPQPTPTPEPAATPATEQSSGSDGCTASVSESSLSIRNNGGSTVITVTLTGLKNTGEVKAVTADWPDIAVFPEPKTDAGDGSFKFSISSISRNTGPYRVIFKTPCGDKLVLVTVN